MLKDKIVLITGGSGGYGKATAEVFHRAGARVIIAARGKEQLENSKNEIGDIDTFAMDVTSIEDWNSVFEYVTKRYRRLDVLVNNAGGGLAIKETTEISVDEIDRIIKLNLNSVIYGSKTFAPLMKEQKSGTIINISSVCARQSWPAWTVYAAAKAGVLSFSKGLYTELRPDNVRVSCVIPAAASTGFQKNSGIGEIQAALSVYDVARTIQYICELPATAVVEDVTIWGIDQEVVPL